MILHRGNYETEPSIELEEGEDELSDIELSDRYWEAVGDRFYANDDWER